MGKGLNLEALKIWASRAEHDELLVAQAQWLAKFKIAECVLHKIIQPRLDYLETISPENVEKRARICEIEVDNQS